ncbi:DEAD box ATP-dependent RNA helicase-like protein 2 [Dinothrombium tinctorium]|uniref:DEAD box ATP-dependent RNA helicase-like protein 2 n=1 Tax=Dinothrombium tinctorium TaxID=1965070 RepID=A0A3S3P5W4_9ACAR|nr:DEAD box ATP-dependent RNA helicase-like protein 2 [Dinothrombium tinctorium]RWS02180.1 DEAD box ATP-dependent RNA helicase-like protein 2 [Dinothrombium tinctorium]
MNTKSQKSEFNALGFSKWLTDKLQCVGIRTPSEVQRNAAAVILNRAERRDLFACSRTGSGKTLAYILPILELLVKDPRPYFALVLAPTRELARQIYDVITLLTGNNSANSGNTLIVKTILVIGGGNYGTGDSNEESQGLWVGKPNIIVATPGRLLDILQNRNYLDVCGSLTTLNFEILVLDEADQLITAGFCEQLKNILEFIDSNEKGNHRRQTLVFSATLTPALEHLTSLITSKDPSRQPVIINLLPTVADIKQEIATNPDLDQRYILCPEYVKTAYLVECLLDLCFKQMIIFCATKKEAKLIHKVLITLGFDGTDFGFKPVLLNADLKQSLRFAAIEKFKSLKSRILVTTDLASRGLDLPQVDLIINYNCPKSATTYVHRVGRTCPSKYKGKSVTFITQYDINLLQSIESFIGKKLEKETAIDEENITTILKQVAVAIKDAEIRIEQEEHELTERKPLDQKRKKKLAEESEEKTSKQSKSGS